MSVVVSEHQLAQQTTKGTKNNVDYRIFMLWFLLVLFPLHVLKTSCVWAFTCECCFVEDAEINTQYKSYSAGTRRSLEAWSGAKLDLGLVRNSDHSLKYLVHLLPAPLDFFLIIIQFAYKL